MRTREVLIPLLLAVALLGPVTAVADGGVGITQDIAAVDVRHQGGMVRIERNPDTENMLDPDFSLTSRPCPPFCIQPMTLAPGVETIGELELLAYLKRVGDDAGVLVIDSRDGDWPLRSGIIPGAVMLPWQNLHPAHADAEKIAEILVFRFGASRQGVLWNFENARTLVFYCNGPWCGQSPTNIKQLLAVGYPADKLKWYRGGMQDWKMLGLTTVAPPKPQ
ncbi:MAG: rhodanese-like protein [bacterium]|nr:MAG: rhodanese-like protein [bacterium]KAF0149883.1 MAG: rhodanese-like protein [bacterium]KAF0166345.1 MAG: rhodanese-like protein [bacterium]TXT16165.1 MAG: rhodanese-like protein [bacterium]